MNPRKLEDTQPNRANGAPKYLAAAFNDDTAPHPAKRFAKPPEDATPQSRSRRPLAITVALAALITIVVAALAAWLMLPPLLSPAPGGTPGYDLSGLAAASGNAGPLGDLLLETSGGIVAAFVPAGAVEQETLLVLQSRLPAMTPELTGQGVERKYPVDLYGTLPSGEPLLIVPLRKPLLLCFQVDETTWGRREGGGIELVVQRYDDILTPQTWIDLPVVPGWTDRQVCALTDHLSLFALGVRQGELAEPHILLQTPAASPTPVDAYGIPTPTP